MHNKTHKTSMTSACRGARVLLMYKMWSAAKPRRSCDEKAPTCLQTSELVQFWMGLSALVIPSAVSAALNWWCN